MRLVLNGILKLPATQRKTLALIAIRRGTSTPEKKPTTNFEDVKMESGMTIKIKPPLANWHR